MMDAKKLQASFAAVVTLLASLSWISVKFEVVAGWLSANLDNIMAVAMIVVAFLPRIQKIWESKQGRVDAAKVETKAAKTAVLPMLLVALLAMSTCGLTGCTMTRAACDPANEECIVEAKVSWPEWFSKWFKSDKPAPQVVPALPAIPPPPKTVEK